MRIQAGWNFRKGQVPELSPARAPPEASASPLSTRPLAAPGKRGSPCGAVFVEAVKVQALTVRPIYLDYNASTPIDPGVTAAMKPFLEDHFGNPSSGHWAATHPDPTEHPVGHVAFWHICGTARRLNDDRLRLESGRGGERRQGDGLSLR